jgi:hypothetical protein
MEPCETKGDPGQPARVQIIGTVVACADGVKDTWRETAAWAAQKLAERFGGAVRAEYFDLFDPHCPALPAGAQIPVVLINGELFSSGGKISVPAIRRHLEALGVKPFLG